MDQAILDRLVKFSEDGLFAATVKEGGLLAGQ
jgi:hypothetical protein